MGREDLAEHVVRGHPIEVTDGMLQVVVRDHGSGVTPDDASDIFETDEGSEFCLTLPIEPLERPASVT